MNMESISSAWKGNHSCEECAIRLNVFRKKKICFFCKNFYCQLCIIRREDKKFCCKKCLVLTARPLNRNELLNLRSRDLVNYLSSRHISTNGCIEKEDLVNVLMKAVNNSCFHSSNTLNINPCTNSCPTTPRNQLFMSNQSNLTMRQMSHSTENLFIGDGIRIRGHNLTEGIQIDEPYVPETSENTNISETENSNGQSSNYISENERLSQQDALEYVFCDEEQERIPNNLVKSNSSEKNSQAIQTSFKPLTLSNIKSSKELDSLSVRQLKELLRRNKTDFKGCIERGELLQKANRLWNDYVLSRKDLDNMSLDELCKICMDAPIECVLLECGHMATCISCGKRLCECPICRQFVVRCVRTFKA